MQIFTLKCKYRILQDFIEIFYRTWLKNLVDTWYEKKKSFSVKAKWRN